MWAGYVISGTGRFLAAGVAGAPGALPASKPSFKKMEDGSLGRRGRSSGPQRPSVTSVTPTNVYLLDTGVYFSECVELGVRVDFVTQATM